MCTRVVGGLVNGLDSHWGLCRCHGVAYPHYHE